MLDGGVMLGFDGAVCMMISLEISRWDRFLDNSSSVPLVEGISFTEEALVPVSHHRIGDGRLGGSVSSLPLPL